jgi:CHAT domain-containing protein
MRERVYGPDHPLVADAQARLAAADFEDGDAPAAFRDAVRADAVSRDQLRRSVRFLTEKQGLDYAAIKPPALDLVVALANTVNEPGTAFDAVIRSRGVVLDELATRAQLGHGDPAGASDVLKRFMAARQRYANLTVQSLRESVPRERLDSARREADDAETLLAKLSAVARDERAQAQAGLDQVVAALPPNSALIGFARYEQPSMAGRSSGPVYGAFVIGPDRTPAFVRLGAAARIDSLIQSWRAQINARSTAAAVAAAGTALRAAVWDPVVARTGNAARVFIVPDGALNLVSFGALPRRGGGYLIEDARVLHLLSTERDLLQAADGKPSRSALIVGGPSFIGQRAAATVSAMRAGIDCRGARPLAFPELPGARAEAQTVSSLWSTAVDHDVVMLSGVDATETAVKERLSGRRVVHLATHAFFLGPGCDRAREGTRAIGGVIAANAPATIVRNPLSLSGLAFAGANRQVPDASDDGILTAQEIASLDLHGTEWAVLSACDTGLGEIRSGEGVLGLRRAFQIAGARTVIMSLWSVDDQATRRWMQSLYEARLTRNLDTADAVRAASLAILSQRRAAKQSTHPFYWAAFVAAGDWR